MDSSTKYNNPSPRLKANPLSKLVFWWLIPLFTYGEGHDLEIKDIHNALPKDLSQDLGNRLERNWKKEEEAAIKTGRKPKLLRALRKTFIYSYLYYGGWIFFLFMVLRILQPVILGYYIWQFEPRDETDNDNTAEAYMYASAIVMLSILIAFIQHHANMGQLEIGMRVRVACSSLLYRKIIRLSRSAVNKTTGGQIINLLSNDVARFEQIFVFLHFIWIMPIQGALIAYLIWQSVQIASLAGVLIIIIQTIPLQGYIGKLTARLREKIAVRTDERVRLMSEIISGIKVIKMYTWEKPFEKIVSLARSYEMEVLTLTSYLRGFNRATYVFTERTTLYFTIMAYVLLGNNISAVQVFTMAQYFNLMQFTIAILYPMAISGGAEALVSIARLEAFLLLEEKTQAALSAPPNTITSPGVVSIKRISASWLDNSITNTLHNISINVQAGELCAVVGPVGAGKSSLLQLILGELVANRRRETVDGPEHKINNSNGTVSVGGVVAYASQQPWLFAGSVRSNILFGMTFDAARYRHVIQVCALVKDFAQLPHGDKTLVGERGSGLSGGQRARINLARAVYRDADIYLLDDPLSAVDTHVGKQLFDECIMGYLGKKTRILVTHQTQYLNDCDSIVMLVNGVLLKQGTYKEMQESNLIKANDDDPGDKDESETSELDKESMSYAEEINAGTDEKEKEDEDETPETEELMAKGPMLKSIYWKYFSAGNSIIVLIGFIIITILGQLGSSGADYWVAYWTNQQELQLRESLLNSNGSSFVPDNNHTELSSSSVIDNYTELSLPLLIDNDTASSSSGLTENMERTEEGWKLDRDTALWIYGGFIIACVVLTSARNLMFYQICMNSSRNLHKKMFSCLLKAPMRFFDRNPSGRILNRFSKDIGAIDEILPTTMLDSLQIFAVMVGILGQVVIIKWWTIFPIIIMCFFYGKIRKFYLSTAQDLKRLEGIAKSPVFSHVNSSLSGLETIRSSGKEYLVRNEFDGHQDLHTGAYSLGIATSSAFGLWLDVVTLTFVAFVTFIFVIFKDGHTYAGSVGLAISQILILCGMMQHGMRQTAETVAQMTGVERILEFTRLDKEGPSESEPGKKPAAVWPANGEIKFDRVYLRYGEGDSPVLKNLNMTIEPGMKIGIVGRTGAGKSSLISALFNLAQLEGKIYIDGINITEIGLNDLRSKISIIPQEPVLFSSTIRNNLDPFDKYEDALLWSALEQVQLKSAVPSLDRNVSEGGNNFSVGQRQLLCLARAIVANHKILILDEATANVDPATDNLIQTTIRENFKNSTVLTIAHRLNTIMDSDMILVIDHGQVVEYNHPHLLLQNPDGSFTKMLQETGRAMTDRLAIISKQAYERKRGVERAEEDGIKSADE